MTNRFLGILLIIAGLVTPMHKEILSKIDIMIMLMFFFFGAVLLFLSFKTRTEEDNIYRCNLEINSVKLFDENENPKLSNGQQLYIQPYKGDSKNEIHILNSDGNFVGKIPNEYCQHVLYKYEHHSPVHLVIKSLEIDKKNDSYDIVIEMMC